MRIVCPHENASVATQFLKTDPNISLNVLDQVPKMNWTVCVRQRGGDEDLSLVHNAIHAKQWLMMHLLLFVVEVKILAHSPT
jgi:hypothetical protein